MLPNTKMARNGTNWRITHGWLNSGREKSMPGPMITKMLQPYSNQNFYRMTQIFHKELIRRETNAALQADVALRVIDDALLGRFFASPDERSNLQAALSELSQMLKELVSHTRKSDYRCHSTEDFHPYDDSMWDAFFAEIVSGVSTRIQTIRQQVGQLEIPELLPEAAELDTRWLQTLQDTKSVVETHLSEVEVFIDADYVETWVE